MAKYTHVGNIVGSDLCSAPGFIKVVALRETKSYWADKSGGLWLKSTGTLRGAGNFPMFRLDVSSITLKA